MRNRALTWAAALESASGADEVLQEAPVAEFEINVNDVDEDGAPLEAVDAQGEPTVDVTMPETEEALDDVEDAEEVVEKLEETSEVLENYAIAIESRIKTNGGLTAGEWEMVQIGLSSRIKNIRAITPSKESFGYSRLSASNEALEEIKNGIKAVWEQIKKAISSVIARVRKWFIDMLGDAGRLAKRAAAIREKANAKSGQAPNLLHYDVVPNLTDLYVNGKEISPELAKTVGEVTNQWCDSALGKLSKDINTLLDEGTKTVAEDTNVDTEKFKALLTKVNDAIQSSDIKNSNSTVVANSKENKNGVDYELTNIFLFGGNGIKIQTVNSNFLNKITENHVITKAIGGIGHKSMDAKFGEKDPKEFKGSVPTIDDIKAICADVENSCKAIQEFKKDFEARGKASDNFIKTMDKVTKNLGDDKENILSVGMVRGFSDFVKNSNTQLGSSINSVMKSNKALLSYTTWGLRAYK